MEMFLMVLCMSVLGLALCAMAFGAATRPERAAEQQAEQPAAQPQPSRAAARFFVEPGALPGGARPRVPVEALLAQIETHVRLEQAAAESFLEYPTVALLHSKTSSPFVN